MSSTFTVSEGCWFTVTPRWLTSNVVQSVEQDWEMIHMLSLVTMCQFGNQLNTLRAAITIYRHNGQCTRYTCSAAGQ